MVRQRMMRLRNPDLRIGTAGLLAAVHERNHAGQIRLIRKHLQVVEQLHVRLEAIGNTGRLNQLRPLSRALLFCLLNSALGISQRLEIITELRVVGRPELLLKLLHARGH